MRTLIMGKILQGIRLIIEPNLRQLLNPILCIPIPNKTRQPLYRRIQPHPIRIELLIKRLGPTMQQPTPQLLVNPQQTIKTRINLIQVVLGLLSLLFIPEGTDGKFQLSQPETNGIVELGLDDVEGGGPVEAGAVWVDQSDYGGALEGQVEGLVVADEVVF
jgi:hypothetical protein